MKSVHVMVPFPPGEKELAKNFYQNKMGFEEIDGDFLVFAGDCSFKVQLREHEMIRLINQNHRLVPIFMYSVETNFLSYCQFLMNHGVQIEYAHSDPGGYYARIVDPFLNWIEISCDNWDELDKTIDPFKWPFFKRY